MTRPDSLAAAWEPRSRSTSVEQAELHAASVVMQAELVQPAIAKMVASAAHLGLGGAIAPAQTSDVLQAALGGCKRCQLKLASC